MIRACFLSTAIAALAMPAAAGEHDAGYSQGMSYGVRPFHLIAKMADRTSALVDSRLATKAPNGAPHVTTGAAASHMPNRSASISMIS